MALSGCQMRMEAFFVFKNDSKRQSNIEDCFVEIVTPPGRGYIETNRKQVTITFCDHKFHPVIKEEIGLSAGDIQPKVDWQEFPEVKISLLSDNDHVVLMYFVDVDAEKRRSPTP